MKISELLQKPEFNEKIESVVSGHIVAVYQKANMEPPIPRGSTISLFTLIQRQRKYAKHLREGVFLMATVLDSFQELEKSEGDNNG